MKSHTDQIPCRPCNGSGLKALSKAMQKTMDALRTLPSQTGSIADMQRVLGKRRLRNRTHKHMISLLKGGLVTKTVVGKRKTAIFTAVKQG